MKTKLKLSVIVTIFAISAFVCGEIQNRSSNLSLKSIVKIAYANSEDGDKYIKGSCNCYLGGDKSDFGNFTGSIVTCTSSPYGIDSCSPGSCSTGSSCAQWN